MSKISYPAIYNDIDLTSVEGLTVLKTDPYRPPKRSLSLANLIRTNKSKLTGAYYTERNITVRVEITRNTRALMEQSLDTLMGILQPLEKALVLNQGVSRRKYYCTFSDSVIVEESAGGSYLELDLVFACSDRFGYDLGATNLLNISSAYTSADRSDGLTFQGSALWQVPVITITYSALTGGTNKAVTIGNGNTGQAVTITRTWTAGDVIQIDCYNKTVKVNNIEVAFTGAIPEWNRGFGYWYYNDALTTRSFTGSITCVFRYV